MLLYLKTAPEPKNKKKTCSSRGPIRVAILGLDLKLSSRQGCARRPPRSPRSRRSRKLGEGAARHDAMGDWPRPRRVGHQAATDALDVEVGWLWRGGDVEVVVRPGRGDAGGRGA